MRLSAEKINETSPYWVIQLDEKTFRVRTDYGVVYRIGFYDDTLCIFWNMYEGSARAESLRRRLRRAVRRIKSRQPSAVRSQKKKLKAEG